MMPELATNRVFFVKDQCWCPRPAGELAQRVLAELPKVNETCRVSMLGTVIEDVWDAGVKEGLRLASERLAAVVFKKNG